MVERFENYAFEEKDDCRTRFNFVDSEESDEIRITTMIVQDSSIDNASLEQDLEELIRGLEEEAEISRKCAISEEYYSLWLEVVDVWRKYQSVKALYINATSPETEMQVKDVVLKYYDGRYRKIINHRYELSSQVDELIKELNSSLEERNFKKISRNWLFNNIGSQRQAQRARGRIKTRLKKHNEPEDIVVLIEKKKNPK